MGHEWGGAGGSTHCTFLRLLHLLSRQKSCSLSRVSSSNSCLIRKLSETSPRRSREEPDLAGLFWGPRQVAGNPITWAALGLKHLCFQN